MKTKLKKAARWLRRIAQNVKPSKATLKLLKQAALNAAIKKAIDTAPDWLPIVCDWLT